MRVAVLALDGVFDLGLSAILDTLQTANDLAELQPARAGDGFDVRVIGLRRHVRTHHGLRVPVAPVSGMRRPDVVIVPALGMKTPDTLVPALERPDVVEGIDLLRTWGRRGTRTCAACGGTFILAATSLLDGGSATTTWWLAPLFRERFPAVALDETQMVVVSGNSVTAAAALAHLDLALWLVRRRSPSLAALVARYLVIDPRPSPAVYAIPHHLAQSDPIVERFERWVRETLSTPFSLGEAARAVGTSERTLSRRLRRVLGRTPLSYVQDLRVERAVHLLRTSDATVDEIASEVGYRDGVTLRNLLRLKTGCGVRELRARDWARDSGGGD
jgi:transcriptional regulator GlxA family with amidase domain